VPRSLLPSPPATLRVRPFALADRGMALAHVDGLVAFVPYAAPGDLVEVAVTRRRKRHLETRLVRVLEPSPYRRDPLCPHFTHCGGCQWQHLPYAEQLAGKDASFRGFIQSRLGLRDPERFRPPLASPREWGYRNRVGWKVRVLGGVPTLGYFATGTHRLVPIRQCPVAHPRLNDLLPRLGAFLRSWPPARQGKLPQVDALVDGTDRVLCVLHQMVSSSRAEAANLAAGLRDAGVAAAWQQTGRKHTLSPVLSLDPPKTACPTFSVRAGDTHWTVRVSPGGFVQANPAVNQLLVDELYTLREHYRGATALDLYCGAGNFTLPLARDAAEVVAVEGYPPAARDAAGNAADSGFPRVRVLAQPVAAAVEQLAVEGLRPRFALLDPPREGAADAMDGLAALGPERILYVSCAPPTLARDLEQLLARGYRVTWTRMADMFPQTAHVESLTLLDRA